jgi:hypothetical protein
MILDSLHTKQNGMTACQLLLSGPAPVCGRSGPPSQLLPMKLPFVLFPVLDERDLGRDLDLNDEVELVLYLEESRDGLPGNDLLELRAP